VIGEELLMTWHLNRTLKDMRGRARRYLEEEHSRLQKE
jgi:hypothetical protein